MSISFTVESTACTVVVRGDGSRCGEPGVTSFVSRSGDVLHECALHAPEGERRAALAAPAAPAVRPHPPTRTTRPFVLVRNGRIVGYAESRPAAQSRAARLGAEVVAVVR